MSDHEQYIPQEILDEIKSRCDIVQIVNEYVPLKKRGANHWGLCPFHSEKTPSFSVSESKQIFYCFGCGKGGNAFRFLMEIEHVSFPEAVKKIAAKTGVRLPEKERSPAERQRLAQRKRLYQINQLAADYYQYVLEKSPESAPFRDYLKKREIHAETISRFKLGAAPKGWDGLYRFLLSKEIAPQEMEQLGLVIARKDDRGYYDRFRERLMFPIANERGEIIAFGGRVLSSEVSMQKYMNSPETNLFQKSRVLYGLAQARQSMRAENAAIVVEGYMDVLSAHQHGLTNVVAPLGTALTSEQAKLMMRNTYNIYTAFDGDTAGAQATLRSMSILTELGCTVKVMRFPKDSDPDDHLRMYGKAGFLQVQDDAQDWLAYKVDYLISQVPNLDVAAKTQILRDVLPDLAQLKGAVAKEEAIRLVAMRLQLSEQSIAAELRQGGRNPKYDTQQRGAGEAPPEKKVTKKSKVEKQEEQLLQVLFAHQELLGLFEDHGGAALFTTSLGADYQKLWQFYSQHGEMTGNDIPPHDAERWAGLIVDQEGKSPEDEVTFVQDYIRYAQGERLDHAYQQLLQKLNEAERLGDDLAMVAVLQEMETLRNQKKIVEHNTGKEA